MTAGDTNTAGIDLPSAPDLFVVHGLAATAIGRALCGCNQLLSLHIEKGQSDGTATPSTSSCGGKNRCSSSGIKIARTFHLLQ